MPSHHTPLHRAAAVAFARAAGVSPDDIKVETPPKPELGDLAIGCFALAKAAKQSPAALAKQLAEAIAAGPREELLASAEAAGPFVNFRVNRPALLRWLIDAALTATLLPRAHGAGKTICIDYGSPNISKHLAYHHIRGTTIGHALAQSHRALGYTVVGINFLGDWGTTHGMVIAAYLGAHPEVASNTPAQMSALPVTVAELHALYVAIRKKPYEEPKTDEEKAANAAAKAAVDALARGFLKRLEDGDAAITALWQRFREVSWAEFEEVYKILDIHYDDLNGESFFWKKAEVAIDELRAKGLMSESEGAQVVALEGEKTPFMVLTTDGTTLYSTRDLAAAEYRWDTYHFERSLYVVDRGQALHFKQLFMVLGLMGRAWSSRCLHVPYGLVQVEGKKTGTRLGNVVLMREVFRIAEADVRAKIAEVNPELPASLVDTVARQVGIGAVIFANLAPQRDKNIEFDIDKAVALDGDSGPYLQIQHARCASIARKANEPVTSVDGVDFTKLTTDAEWAVAKKLLDFPDIVVRSTDNAEPHIICHYLLELAGEFSRWYTQGNGDAALRVLVDDPLVRRARLALVAAIQATLREGLSLLGMAAPDQM